MNPERTVTGRLRDLLAEMPVWDSDRAGWLRAFEAQMDLLERQHAQVTEAIDNAQIILSDHAVHADGCPYFAGVGEEGDGAVDCECYVNLVFEALFPIPSEALRAEPAKEEASG